MDKEREENLLAGDLNAFAWTYSQKAGELQQDGKHVATGYSGAGSGKNHPERENVHNVGPPHRRATGRSWARPSTHQNTVHTSSR